MFEHGAAAAAAVRVAGGLAVHGDAAGIAVKVQRCAICVRPIPHLVHALVNRRLRRREIVWLPAWAAARDDLIGVCGAGALEVRGDGARRAEDAVANHALTYAGRDAPPRR